ncbi:MAG: hypothetical protein WBP13_12035 [Methylophilaceae bacterium]
MPTLLRTLIVFSFTSLLIIGCEQKAAAPEQATVPAEVVKPTAEATTSSEPATTAPAATAPATTESGGGYVPTPEERVPGITVDATTEPVTDTTPSTETPTATTEVK